jgi:D-glycero-D-manno-heptose 1,7-bisphosphate phosphatase
MNKFVFLDRDGVVNIERGMHTWLLEDFSFTPDFQEGMKKLNEAGYRFVVISNQSGIAKGMYTWDDVKILEKHISKHLEEVGVTIEEYFYCPHHPDFGKCLCRKPEGVLFEKALAKYKVNANLSWMVGDKKRDVLPAEKLGMQTILVEANTNFNNIVEQIVQ